MNTTQMLGQFLTSAAARTHIEQKKGQALWETHKDLDHASKYQMGSSIQPNNLFSYYFRLWPAHSPKGSDK